MKLLEPMQHSFDDKLKLDNYIEYGSEKGAHVSGENLTNPDMSRIFEATKPMGLNEALAWLDEHECEFDTSTVIVDTDDGDSLTQYRDRKPQVIIEKRALNLIRHMNTVLNRSNEVLEPGGYLWCHARTAVLKKQMIMSNNIWGVRHIIYLLHFIWHRIFPSMKWTRAIYMAITKGKNRTYHRVEVLGRMYRAGFEVIDEEFRWGEFFVLARKIKEPIWNDIPSRSPIIYLRRIGKGGKIIRVYKFRTMYPYSEYLQPYIYEHNHLQLGGKFADDYRVTPWGKWMRKLWIDELPMILNMFKGELKLVGVRPLSRHYFSLYSPEMQELRVKVRPGLLPPFYYDKKTPETIEEVQESERRYIEQCLKHPFITDIKYFFGTIGNIIFQGKTSK